MHSLKREKFLIYAFAVYISHNILGQRCATWAGYTYDVWVQSATVWATTYSTLRVSKLEGKLYERSTWEGTRITQMRHCKASCKLQLVYGSVLVPSQFKNCSPSFSICAANIAIQGFPDLKLLVTADRTLCFLVYSLPSWYCWRITKDLPTSPIDMIAFHGTIIGK